MDMMEDEDEYFWTKSKNCIFHRRAVRNACAHLGMAHLKTEGTLIKTIHVATEDGEWTEEEATRFDDLSPFTIYSLNKRKRWETEDNIGVEILERTNRFHENTADVVFLERVNLKTFEWKYVPWVRYPKDFLIRCVHSIKKSENEPSSYERSELNTIYGQPYSHFLSENRKSSRKEQKETTALETDAKNPIVAYNFIRAPKNYMRLGEQFFVTSNYGSNFFPPYQGYRRRIAQLEDSRMQIRYWDPENEFPEGDDPENDSETNPEATDNLRKPSTHYNLANHIITPFVFVKRRKIKVPLG